jgi:pyruvate kinase
MAAVAEIGAFTAARMAAPALKLAAAHAPAAAAPPQPRRAVAARSLRTVATETLTADLAGATNGAVHAQVSGILARLGAQRN